MNNLQIIIPMAGYGSRFANAGFDVPKPYIQIKDKTMVELVIANLYYPDAKYICIAKEDHLQYINKISSRLENQNTLFHLINVHTEGTACTILTAIDRIDPESPLIIANSDQYVDFSFVEFIDNAENRDLDGSILVFKDISKNPKWSFAKIDENNFVTEVKEKVPISEFATVGIYYFKKAKYFINNAIKMVALNDRVNNEFYTCPVYNYLIEKELKVGIFEIEKSNMYGLGTPEDLEIFLTATN